MLISTTCSDCSFLRELQPLCVFATQFVRRILTEDNSMFAMLQRVPDQVRWIDFAPASWFSLTDPCRS